MWIIHIHFMWITMFIIKLNKLKKYFCGKLRVLNKNCCLERWIKDFNVSFFNYVKFQNYLLILLYIDFVSIKLKNSKVLKN